MSLINNSYGNLRRSPVPIARADCSTLAIAKTQFLLCGTDDGKMIRICEKYTISYTRTLRLLKEMIETQHKSPDQILAMGRILVEERGKWIKPSLLEEWKRQILSM
jgi:hypothetical protein